MTKAKSLKIPPDFPIELFKPLNSSLENETGWIKEIDLRMEALKRHYNCPTDRVLVAALLMDLIPGVLPHTRRPGGRPSEGELGEEKRALLLARVEKIQESECITSDLEACRRVQSLWKHEYEQFSVHTLRSWANRARFWRFLNNPLIKTHYRQFPEHLPTKLPQRPRTTRRVK